MTRKRYSTKLFYRYYHEWIELYKKGAIRDVTLDKYYLTYRKLVKLAPNLHMNELDRRAYQKILNQYALTHERQTTMDFHHHLKAAIIDALDDGLLESDPTRRVIIKGKKASTKKSKFLNLVELQMLLRHLDLGDTISWDWFILLVAKTGLRFAEALALTPNDFDFEKQVLNVNKSWNYKEKVGHFQPTKNKSSNRTVIADWQMMSQFKVLIKGMQSDLPIFVNEGQRIHNSSVNHL